MNTPYRAPVERVQDSVHGLMEFDGMETAVVALLDTRELHRLRHIRQLGLVHLVFPGAEHSRFTHALGSAHLAIRFARQLASAAGDCLDIHLCPLDEDIRAVALAALCHDVGHGPLSHVWEREAVGDDFGEQRQVRSAWRDTLGLSTDDALLKLEWHELVTQALLMSPEGDLHKRLERHEEGLAALICGLLTQRYWLPYVPRLLVSDVDVDRCDFVMRDTQHTGVAYGRYDLDRLVSTLTVGFYRDRPVVGFDASKAPRVLEQFLIARRALYDTVYQHRTVRAAEAMVGLLFRRLRTLLSAGQDLQLPHNGLFAAFRKVLAGQALEPPEILTLDDDVLWLLVRVLAEDDSTDPLLGELAKRIRHRRLFKLVPATFDQAVQFRLPNGLPREDLARLITEQTGYDGSYFCYVERETLDLLAAEEEREAYLVALSNNRRAEPITDRNPFTAMKAVRDDVSYRIFVPGEALKAATALVTGDA